jgi:predicted transcriptional regulator
VSSASSQQDAILRYLSTRFSYGDSRFCTIPTILKNTGIDASNQYILTLMDELEMSGLIMTRQAYSMKGGNLFQITGKGLDFISQGKKLTSDSSAWTGRIDVSIARKMQIQKRLVEIRRVIDEAQMSNAARCNVLAVVGAIDSLVEAPDPPWAEILRLIRNPTLQGVLAIAGLLLTIIGLILPESRVQN